MQATLEVTTGPCAGRRFALPPGQAVRIGRTDKADQVMADDTFLSSAHFYVQWSGEQCVVHDLNSSNGTFLNGTKVTESAFRPGDVITAGQSSFELRLLEPEPMTTLYNAVRHDETRAMPIAVPPPLPGPALSPVHEALLNVLSGLAGNLYAVLNVSLLDGFLEQNLDLKAETLSDHASLVAVDSNSRGARQLVARGWGAGWGFYTTSQQPTAIVRNHLKRFQTLLTPDGAEFEFRFVQPELLGAFLATLNSGEAKTFFGPLSAILSEGGSADELLLFMPGPSGVLEKRMPLVDRV